MEKELNIANILKDKPTGTKLYADAFGELKLERVRVNEVDAIYTKNKTSTLYCFYNDGKYNKNGEPILVPSKEMRDWRKFDWKKGDVLVSEGMGRLHVIFEGFDDDTYLTFKGKHYLCNYDDDEDYNEEEYNDYHKELILRTIEFKKDNVNDAQTYINTIEEKLGGKLNCETLEIEKTQLEFKDGETKYQFKPFEKVLVRDTCNDIWKATFFSHIKDNDNSIYKYVCDCISWRQCIPYEGNENLLGTTKNVEG